MFSGFSILRGMKVKRVLSAS